MKIEKLTGFMGAEITDIDLTNGINQTNADELRTALSQQHMIVIRNQHLSIAQQKELNEVFGPTMQLPYVSPLKDDADVIAVLKEADEQNTGVFGGEWHTDFSFLENPPAGSVLNAVEIPSTGGDTVWASQVAAYESLPADLKEIVDTHNAIHVGKPYGIKWAPPASARANGSVKMTRGDPNADREVPHPAVITDQISGKKALFLNVIYVTRFEGMSEEESAPILDAIYKHCTRPDFSCRLKWQAGDVAVWDNRMTLHYATNDYDGARRLLYRTTFAGERPS